MYNVVKSTSSSSPSSSSTCLHISHYTTIPHGSYTSAVFNLTTHKTHGTKYLLKYSMLASLSNFASTSTFTKSTSASPSFIVYGWYSCRGELSNTFGHFCVRSDKTQLAPICTFSFSTAIYLCESMLGMIRKW